MGSPAQRDAYHVSATGVVSSSTLTRIWLLGLRYLTVNEVTWIADWIHNGMGYSDSELGDYYRFLNLALASGAPQSGPARPSAWREVAFYAPTRGRTMFTSRPA